MANKTFCEAKVEEEKDEISPPTPEADALLFAQRDSLRRMIGMRLDPAISSREDASDIVQNVMIEAHRRLGEYLKKPTMPFLLWLRHIAMDHIIEAHRRHRQAQRRSLDREQSIHSSLGKDDSDADLGDPFVDRAMTPASAAIQSEIRNRIEESIEAMPEEDRLILRLRHKDQLSNQEVAVILKISEAAASMRYLRAIRKLKTGLTGTSGGILE